jgi:type VI protein secretion system component Hcp
MASYLRFDNRRFSGESKHKPREGWIDVVSWGLPSRAGVSGADRAKPRDQTDGTIYVTCVMDRASVQLFDAFQRGEQQVGSAVLEDWQRKVWTRLTMTDVFLASVRLSQTGDGTSVTHVTLDFRQSTVIVGKQ